jgi:hypothetical protein
MYYLVHVFLLRLRNSTENQNNIMCKKELFEALIGAMNAASWEKWCKDRAMGYDWSDTWSDAWIKAKVYTVRVESEYEELVKKWLDREGFSKEDFVAGAIEEWILRFKKAKIRSYGTFNSD